MKNGIMEMYSGKAEYDNSITKYYSPIAFDMANLTSNCRDNSEIQLDYY